MGLLSKGSLRKKKLSIPNHIHIKRHVLLLACFFVIVTLFMASFLITPESVELTEEPKSTFAKYPSIDDGTQSITSGIRALDNGDHTHSPLNVNEYLTNESIFTAVSVNNTSGTDYTGNELSFEAPPKDISGGKNLAYFNFTTNRIMNATSKQKTVEDGGTLTPIIIQTLYAQEFSVSSANNYYYLTNVTIGRIGLLSGGSFRIEVRNSTTINEPGDSSQILASYDSGIYSLATQEDHFVWNVTKPILLKKDRPYYVVFEIINSCEFYSIADGGVEPDDGNAFHYVSGWDDDDVDYYLEYVHYHEAFHLDTGSPPDDLDMDVTVSGTGSAGPYNVAPISGGTDNLPWRGGTVDVTMDPTLENDSNGMFYIDIDVDDTDGGRDLLIDANVTVVYLWDTDSTDQPTGVENGNVITWNVTYDPEDPTENGEISSPNDEWYDYYFGIDPFPSDWTVLRIEDNGGTDRLILCEIGSDYVIITREAIVAAGIEGDNEWTIIGSESVSGNGGNG